MSPPVARESLLVVDDDKIILDLLCRTFKPMYEVHSAGSGEAALEVLRDTPVDLLITDQKMPGMTGLELLRELDAAGRTIPSLLITGLPDPVIARAARELGAIEVLTKPIDSTRLLQLIAFAVQ